jgi:hypothetical protein
VRKQALFVTQNVVHSFHDHPLTAAYLGYGSCPLTIERGRIILAEFGYGGTLQPVSRNGSMTAFIDTDSGIQESGMPPICQPDQ